ncbi:MAG: LppX_LprAFG lipoprotein, partial [Acidimicrobiales bacterium]|nr:LppX_LprAFG lipoprotein [Acidimicrobiales bacterium]
GSFEVALKGFVVDVKVAAIHGVFEAELPFSTGYTKTDPANFGLHNPAELFDPATGLTKLLTLADQPKLGATERIRGELLDTVTYQVPGTAIPVLPDADPSRPVTMTVAINPSSYQLRVVTLVGRFTSATTDSTYTLTLSNYDEHVTVTLPRTS